MSGDAGSVTKPSKKSARSPTRESLASARSVDNRRNPKRQFRVPSNGESVAEKILIGFLCILATALVSWLVISREYYRGSYFAQLRETDEALDRAIAAAKSEEKTLSELNYLKQIFSRPIMAAISDQQMEQLSSQMASLCQAMMTEKNKMN